MTAGAVFCILVLISRFPTYRNFPEIGPFYRFANGDTLHLALVPILTDWTYLMIVLGFCFRMRPVERNDRGGDVAIGLLGSYWLFLPFAGHAFCRAIDQWMGTNWAAAYGEYWMSSSLSLARTLTGAGLVAVGNLIDAWGYGVLFRSFSLVPEARELRVTGPYRVMRHPVYFGQILAQAGVYLFFASRHLTWILFWLVFFGLQLTRAWREEKVLERAFGEDYLRWKRHTFWIW